MKHFFILIIIFAAHTVHAQTRAHLDTARAYVGVTELTGKNDGVEVERFLRSVGLGKGAQWCAAFVSHCLTQARVQEPRVRSARAQRFITKESVPASKVLRGEVRILPGTILVWKRGETAFGHVGFVSLHAARNSFRTIEGNTSSGVRGSQWDGGGVYERMRAIQPGNYFRITHFTFVR